MALTLRTATTADLDDLASIACAAFPADPQWDYRFPRRKEFPEDTYKCTREGYKSMLEEDGVIINVITTDVHGEQKPIALAVWELMFEKTSNFLDIGTSCGLLVPIFRPFLSKQRSKRSTVDCDDRRDADFKRMKAFDDACFKAKKTFFDDVYGDQQIHLRILATHPDWQRHGAGTKHCNWGRDVANEHRIPVTVLSSPLGGQLYSYLGYDTLGFFKVQVEGEDVKLSIGAMIKYYENEDEEFKKEF
ncbi:Nn.00g105060.m01.CDS01 [Neocucurbitaria sp. VM-36]